MKKLLLTLMLFALVAVGFAQTPTNGDYRSIASGNWSNPATWQTRTAGSWATASTAPTTTNNVYIQGTHTITVDIASVNCKDLNINITGNVAIGANVLNVSGKIRGFSGSADISANDGGYTGTSSTALASSMITTTDPGVLKFVGLSRNITEVGEWTATATTNDVEFALNANETGTMLTDMKFNNWTITSGVLSSAFRLVVSNNIKIKSGAKVLSSRSGTTSSVIGASSVTKSNTFTIDAGGVLELTGTTPAIDVTTFINNGTVLYSKAGSQTLLQKGADPTSLANFNYNTLALSGTSAKTASGPFTVNTLLDISGAATLSAVAPNSCTMANGSTILRATTGGTTIASTTLLILGTQATDLVNVVIGSSVALSGEIPTLINQSPGKIGKLTIKNGVTYNLTGGRNVTDLENSGVLVLGPPSTTMTLAINGNISGSGTITGHASASLSFTGENNGNGGVINFTPGSRVLNNLTIDRTGIDASVTLGTDVVMSAVGTNQTGTLTIQNGRLKIMPSVTLTVQSGKILSGTGTFSNATHIETQKSGANVGQLKVSGITSAITIPVGENGKYLPVILNPTSSSDFVINVFTGATANATPNGTPLTAGQKTNMVDAIYNINRTLGSGACDVTLGWDASLEGADFANLTNAEIGVTQFDGANYGTFTGPGDNTSNSITSTVSSFAPFLVGKVGVLPVKLISFVAKASNQTAVLNWKTTSEVNLSHYLVQRSLDGKAFETLTSINAKNTAGIFNYSFTDHAPALGANYYQLASVDTDGKTSISQVQAVNFGGLAILVYPNPTKESINITGLVGGDFVTVTDLVGRKISSYQVTGEKVINLRLDHSNSGIYLLTISNKGKITSSQRIIKI